MGAFKPRSAVPVLSLYYIILDIDNFITIIAIFDKDSILVSIYFNPL